MENVFLVLPLKEFLPALVSVFTYEDGEYEGMRDKQKIAFLESFFDSDFSGKILAWVGNREGIQDELLTICNFLSSLFNKTFQKDLETFEDPMLDVKIFIPGWDLPSQTSYLICQVINQPTFSLALIRQCNRLYLAYFPPITRIFQGRITLNRIHNLVTSGEDLSTLENVIAI